MLVLVGAVSGHVSVHVHCPLYVSCPIHGVMVTRGGNKEQELIAMAYYTFIFSVCN